MSTLGKLEFDWYSRTLDTSNILGETIRVGRQYRYLYEFPEYRGADQGRNIVLVAKNGGVEGKKFPTLSLDSLEGVNLETYENFLGFSGGFVTSLLKPVFALEDLADVDITSYTDTFVVTYVVEPVTGIARWRLRPEAYSLETLSDVDYRATPSAHRQILRNVTNAEQSSSSPSAPKGVATTDPFSLEFDNRPGLSDDIDSNRFGIYNHKCKTQFIALASGEFEAVIDTRNFDVFYVRTPDEFVEISFITSDIPGTIMRYLLVEGASYIKFNYPHVELENGYIPSNVGTVCSYCMHIRNDVLTVLSKGLNYE